jgi:hypothetical protein
MEKKKLIILGLGNIIMKDEGFGVHFLRWFLSVTVCPETWRPSMAEPWDTSSWAFSINASV